VELHLIISDVEMPSLVGIGFLKAVRTRPDYSFTPVIILTTAAGQDDKNERRGAGARA
jgi:two-component system chemotaxis response regulator CheY